MIPAKVEDGLSENEMMPSHNYVVRETLEKFQRNKILEVYFLRLDGRIPDDIPFEYKELYQIDLHRIKTYLLGQQPIDPILQNIFRIVN